METINVKIVNKSPNQLPAYGTPLSAGTVSYTHLTLPTKA